MKINNTSIRGFYIYSDSDIYESGDFVVYGNTIYVCSPQSGNTEVTGEKPYESKNYYVYLGDQLSDIEEFKNFASEGGGKDKYLSLSTLVGALNMYMKGLNTTGIIGHEYELTPTVNGLEVIYKVNNVITEVYTEKAVETVLATLLIDENVNHGIFKVSKNLPEIRDIVGDTGSYCILKQYSYYSGTNLIRVQELIDIETSVYYNPSRSYANIYYRTASLSSSLEDVKNTEFVSATAHSDFLVRKATKLFNTYSTKMKLFDVTMNKLKNNFCFTGISLPDTKVNRISLQNTDSSKSGYLEVGSFSELGPITLNVMVQEKFKDSYVYSSNSLTIDPTIGHQKYYINDDLLVNVIFNEEEVETKEIKFINNTTYPGEVFMGLGKINEDLSISSGSSMNVTSEGWTLNIPTNLLDQNNNVTLDFKSMIPENSDDYIPFIFEYELKEEGEDNPISGPYIGIFKPNGTLSINSSDYKYFDLNRTVELTPCRDYLFSSSGEVINVESPIIVVKNVNESKLFDLSITNSSGLTMYYPTVSKCFENEFEILPNETKVFEKALINVGDSSRGGIYFYMKKPAGGYSEIPVLEFSLKINEINIKTESIIAEEQEDKYIFGDYNIPIVSFKDIFEKSIKKDSKVEFIFNISNIDHEVNEQVEEVSLMSLEYEDDQISSGNVDSCDGDVSAGDVVTTTTTTENPINTTTTTTSDLPITTTTTTSAPATPELPPLFEGLMGVKSIIIELEGSLSKNSWISSAYCRKYFHG